MPEDKHEQLANLRQALVEAMATQKLLAQKLEKHRADLALWEKRLAEHSDDDQIKKEAEKRIPQLKRTMAEIEADMMAQKDSEAQLKATIFRLENKVVSPDYPNVSDLVNTRDTIGRMEKKIMTSEAMAELSEDKDRETAAAAEAASIDDELAALKAKMKEKKNN